MKNILNNAKLSLDHIRRRRGCAGDLKFCRRGGILTRDVEKSLFANSRAHCPVGTVKRTDENDGPWVCNPSFII